MGLEFSVDGGAILLASRQGLLHPMFKGFCASACPPLMQKTLHDLKYIIEPMSLRFRYLGSCRIFPSTVVRLFEGDLLA